MARGLRLQIAELESLLEEAVDVVLTPRVSAPRVTDEPQNQPDIFLQALKGVSTDQQLLSSHQLAAAPHASKQSLAGNPIHHTADAIATVESDDDAPPLPSMPPHSGVLSPAAEPRSPSCGSPKTANSPAARRIEVHFSGSPATGLGLRFIE